MSRRVDVVVVQPPNRLRVYQSLASDLIAVEPPVWAGLLAQHLRARGCAIELIDAEAEELTPDQVAERIADLDPVLAAVVVFGHQPSASTQSMPGAGAVCASLRRAAPTVKTIMIGGHV